MRLRRQSSEWALWAAFAAVLALKLWFIGQHGTRDMDVAIGWGRALLDRGLAQGYTGSNFPLAFQVYEGVVAFAREAGVDPFAAMKGLNLLCDLFTFFAMRTFLRRAGHDPRWAFLYWLSPFFVEMWLVGYDHFQMMALVMLALLAAQRARHWWGWLAAGVPLGLAFVDRPQAQALVGAVALFAGMTALAGVWRARAPRGALNPRSVPATLLLVPTVLLWSGYAAYFAVARGDGGYLVRSYTDLASFSPALSANMLNVWQAVAEAYRRPGEYYSQVWGPAVYHQLAAAVAGAAIVAAVALVARARGARPLRAVTVLGLFAVAAILLPNLYTRAHDAHFFFGGALAVLLAPLLPRPQRLRFAVALGASLALQGLNTFGIYGFGLTPRTRWAWVQAFEAGWTFHVRLGAALVNVALFVAMLVALRPLVAAAPRGDREADAWAPAPPAPSARRATPA